MEISNTKITPRANAGTTDWHLSRFEFLEASRAYWLERYINNIYHCSILFDWGDMKESIKRGKLEIYQQANIPYQTAIDDCIDRSTEEMYTKLTQRIQHIESITI